MPDEEITKPLGKVAEQARQEVSEASRGKVRLPDGYIEALGGVEGIQELLRKQVEGGDDPK
jgi:hypothetical protein